MQVCSLEGEQRTMVCLVMHLGSHSEAEALTTLLTRGVSCCGNGSP